MKMWHNLTASLLFAIGLCALLTQSYDTDTKTLRSFYSELPRASQAILTTAGWNFVNCVAGKKAALIDNICTCDYACNGCYKPRATYFYLWNRTVICDGEQGRIISLNLQDYTVGKLSGTLSSSLASLGQLKILYLGYNDFSGKLPPEWGALKSLSRLSLIRNKLTGTWPESWKEMTSLSFFDSSQNLLSGPLPSYIVEMKNLISLFLSDNKFSGTLSDRWANLPSLKILTLSRNSISGRLPDVLIWPTIEIIHLQYNRFSGSIAHTFTSMTRLQYLNISFNGFSGLTNSLTTLSSLVTLDARGNMLRGALPSLPRSLAVLLASNNRLESVDLSNLPNIKLVNVSNNQIRQTLNAYEMPNLLSLDVSYNHFYGQLSSLTGLSNLLQLYGDDNAFTGPLPDLNALASLEVLSLPNNFLAHDLQNNLKLLTSLKVLDLSNNHLGGVLPGSLFATQSRLITLALSRNEFIGPAPSSLSNLRNLQFLHLQHNSFTSLPGLSALTAVQDIDISFNMIMGTLAASLFINHANLQTFVASSNCIHGSISAAICDASSLRVLVLDGATLSCPYGASSIHARLSGGIASCIFALPNLTTLHLSGNGLTGTLASIVPPKLRDLSVAYNLIGDRIPQELLRAASQFSNLDLTFNKFSGNLGEMDAPSEGSTVKLLVNRLSGKLSESLLGSQKGRILSVLEGSMFDCNSLKPPSQTLPTNDPYVNQFQCGSSSLDKYFYAFICVSVLLFLLLHAYAMRVKGVSASDKAHDVTGSSVAFELFPQPPKDVPSFISRIFNLLLRLRIFACVLGGGLALTLFPVYAIANATSSTQEFAYAYTISAAFKTGSAPAAVFFLIWTLLLLFNDFAISVFVGYDKRQEGKPEKSQMFDYEQKWTAALHARLAVIFAFNTISMVGSNILYIYIVSTANVAGQVAGKLAFAGFKFAYNNYVLPLLNRRKLFGAGVDFRGADSFECVLLIINIFVIPSIVTALQVKSCFEPLLTIPSPISVQFTSSSCKTQLVPQFVTSTEARSLSGFNISQTCIQVTHESSFQPPFHYTYLCSSFLLRTYAPIFLLISLLSITEFAAHNALALLLTRVSALKSVRLVDFVLLQLPPKLLLTHEQRMRKRKYEAEDRGEIPLDLRNSVTARQESRHLDILDLKGLYFKIVSDLLGTLSFGIVFPILAITLSVSIYVRCIRKHHMLLRYVEGRRGRGLCPTRLAPLSNISLHSAPADERALIENSMHALIKVVLSNAKLSDDRHHPLLTNSLTQIASRLDGEQFDSFDELRMAILDVLQNPSKEEDNDADADLAKAKQWRLGQLSAALDQQNEWDYLLNEAETGWQLRKTPVDSNRFIVLLFSSLFLFLFLFDIDGDAEGRKAIWTIVMVLVPILIVAGVKHFAWLDDCVRAVQARLLPRFEIDVDVIPQSSVAGNLPEPSPKHRTSRSSLDLFGAAINPLTQGRRKSTLVSDPQVGHDAGTAKRLDPVHQL